MRYTSIIKYTIHNKTIIKRFINQYFETFYNLNLLNAYHRKTSERIEISYLFEQCLQYKLEAFHIQKLWKSFFQAELPCL